jgi:hypothetical protein
MDTTADAAALLCPDPDWMAYQGWNISLRIGNLDSSGDLPKVALSEFTKDDKGDWRYKSSLGGGPVPATVEQREGLTIIRAVNAGRRGYCAVGGYDGLEDEELALILFNGRWILMDGGPQSTEVVDLLLMSATPRK